MDATRKFLPIDEEHGAPMREVLRAVYHSLEEKGYDPLNQIVGYLLSEDPTYITNHLNARALIRKLERDELMQELVKSYLALDEE